MIEFKSLAEKMTVEKAVETTVEKSLKTPALILRALRDNPKLTLTEVAKKIAKSPRMVERAVAQLVKDGYLEHIGPKKSGTWVIKKEPEMTVEKAVKMSAEKTVKTPVEKSRKTPELIMRTLRDNPKLALTEIAKKLNKSPRAVERAVAQLVKDGYLERIGPKKSGTWIIKKLLNG